jgi:hypothetical protein
VETVEENTRLTARRLLKTMARPEGFEPPTPRFVVWCSVQLSYGRNLNSITSLREVIFYIQVHVQTQLNAPRTHPVDASIVLDGGLEVWLKGVYVLQTEANMHYTLDSFASECRRILTADPSQAGRKQVCELVQEVLQDKTFLARYLNENTPDRQVIYEDPELGFCICAHFNREAREANPHDHGTSWAIYGQAFGETEMSDWEILEPASEKKPGKVRRGRVYSLKPGMAHLYNEGDVHSPKRVAATGLIRIEGTDTQKLKRFSYQSV